MLYSLSFDLISVDNFTCVRIDDIGVVTLSCLSDGFRCGTRPQTADLQDQFFRRLVRSPTILLQNRYIKHTVDD